MLNHIRKGGILMKKVSFTAGALRLVGAAGCFGLIGCCNGVFTLKDGVVLEHGTFDELMEDKGYFYSLFTISQS